MSLATVAEVLQWALIVTLGVLVLSLVRQVAALTGLLRDGRALATAARGPRPHLPLGPQTVVSQRGDALTLGEGRPALLLFLTEGCSTCRGMKEALRGLGEEIPESELALGFVEAEPEAGAAGRAHALRREAVPPLLVPDSPPPAALAVAPDGRVAAVGAPRVADHLREMSLAARFADSTGDGHMLRHHVWGDAVPSWQT